MFFEGISLSESIALVGVWVPLLAFVYGIVHNAIQAWRHRNDAPVEKVSEQPDETAITIARMEVQIEELQNKLNAMQERMNLNEATCNQRVDRLEDKLSKFVDVVIQYFTNKND